MRTGRSGRCACAARCAVSVLLPDPPLREAKTMTFMMALRLAVRPANGMNLPCGLIRHYGTAETHEWLLRARARLVPLTNCANVPAEIALATPPFALSLPAARGCKCRKTRH